MRARRLALALAALTLALLAASPAAVAEPRPSLHTIEREVMCPVCGTLLELAEAPQAQRQRIYITKLIGAGMSKQEIKDELVAEYGPEVLALPRASGFQLSAYLVPAIAFVVAVLALAIGLRRWRRAGHGGGGPGGSPLRGADAERLEADLARYDL